MEHEDKPLRELFEPALRAAIDLGASDVHIGPGRPVRVRLSEGIRELEGFPPPTPHDTLVLAALILHKASRGDRMGLLKQVKSLRDDDCSLHLNGLGRFRVNLCRQRGAIELVLRVVPDRVPTIEDLGLPAVLHEIAMEERGLVLITGTTGSGKSTTLATLIDHINRHRQRKIVTIEDPIEYLHRDARSMVTQREVGADTESFGLALRAALRQDPDVIMVGEMRDRETIDVALKAAETGHLVLSTAHTTDAARTIHRVVSVFDSHEQATVRLRLAEVLKATVAQRLVARNDRPGRIAALEIMRVTLSIQRCIEDPSKEGINDHIAEGDQYGMQTFDQHLCELYGQGVISLQTARAAATSPTDFERNLAFN